MTPIYKVFETYQKFFMENTPILHIFPKYSLPLLLKSLMTFLRSGFSLIKQLQVIALNPVTCRL